MSAQNADYERPLHVYRLDVEYPEGSDKYGWEPEGWDSPWNGDPEADLDFHWPRVRPYLSRSGAEARAKLLRSFGAKVTIVRSLPVVFEAQIDGSGRPAPAATEAAGGVGAGLSLPGAGSDLKREMRSGVGDHLVESGAAVPAVLAQPVHQRQMLLAGVERGVIVEPECDAEVAEQALTAGDVHFASPVAPGSAHHKQDVSECAPAGDESQPAHNDGSGAVS